MKELTWICDPATGELTVEGVTAEEARALIGDLLPPPRPLNCARPRISPPLPSPIPSVGPVLRVYRIYHGSVVDGPGRRSVCQVAGCTHHCPLCYLPETHDPNGGVALGIGEVLNALLDPAGEPRDGITVTGGEPFQQPSALAALLTTLKARGIHVMVYTGYTLEALLRRSEPEIRAALACTDLLCDGPFVAALAEGAGEWRGSRNQSLIAHPSAAMPGQQAIRPVRPNRTGSTRRLWRVRL